MQGLAIMITVMASCLAIAAAFSAVPRGKGMLVTAILSGCAALAAFGGLAIPFAQPGGALLVGLMYGALPGAALGMAIPAYLASKALREAAPTANPRYEAGPETAIPMPSWQDPRSGQGPWPPRSR